MSLFRMLDPLCSTPASGLLVLSFFLFGAFSGSADTQSAADVPVLADSKTPPPGTWNLFPDADFDGSLGHAPIGVMLDHPHEKGEFMLSLRYMSMYMDGMMDGTDSISASKVTNPNSYDYLVSPTNMTTQMIMFGAMWAPIKEVTLALMVPYLFKDMDHVVGQGPVAGQRFTTRANGIGDISVAVMIPIIRNENQLLMINIGWGFPTGSIDETDNNPFSDMMLGGKVQLPYPMQMGSGSFEWRPSVIYQQILFGHLGVGAKASAKIRLNDNDNGYRLGEEYEVTAWSALEVLEFLSASFRLAWQQNFNISGRDRKLMTNFTMPMLAGKKTVPTAFPGNQGYRRLYGFWGINLWAPQKRGFFRGHRLAIEVGFPFYQSLDGPQLRDRVMGTVGWQYSF
jgi:hypothetical protein